MTEAAARPSSAEALVRLGTALLDQGQSEAPIAMLSEAVALDPGFAGAHASLGRALKARGQVSLALESYRRAIALEPHSAGLHAALATVLREVGRIDEADAGYRSAIAVDSGYVDAYLDLAKLLRRQARLAEAGEVLDRCLEATPDDPRASFLRDALAGRKDIARAPDAYVIQEFDHFAPTFDERLRNELAYRGPEMTEELLKGVLPEDAALDVLDVGCGTGLSGVPLRCYARYLAGIDLSPQMLARARLRGIYDDLHEGEISHLLAEMPSRYDLIAAADVLIYFGDFAFFAERARDALREGGYLAMTFEKTDEPVPFLLTPSGRYRHAAAYVREIARTRGFDEVRINERRLRKEAGLPVAGLACLFRKERRPTPVTNFV